MYYLNLIIKQKKSQKLLVFLLNFLWVLVILLVCQHFRNFSQEINETLQSSWKFSGQSGPPPVLVISKNSCFQSYFAIELVILKEKWMALIENIL